MCDPVSAAVAVAGSAYSANQQRKAAKEAAAQQAEANRIAQQQFEEQQRLEQQRAEEARQAELRRQANISQGMSEIDAAFGQFNDGFFDARRQSYVDFARPQLERQFQDAQRQLVRSLSRSGNLQSSARAEAMADLQRQFDTGLADIISRGTTYANQTRDSVNQARQNLVSQNAQLADPGTIRNLAGTQTSSLMQQGGNWSPLGQLISALSSAADEEAPRRQGKANTGVGLLSNNLTTGTGTVVN